MCTCMKSNTLYSLFLLLPSKLMYLVSIPKKKKFEVTGNKSKNFSWILNNPKRIFEFQMLYDGEDSVFKSLGKNWGIANATYCGDTTLFGDLKVNVLQKSP